LPQKVLIYRLGSLGDTIIVLPCFHKVKDVFPDADITLLTNRPVASKAAPLEAVLGSEYFFNRVIDYPVGTRNLIILFKLLIKLRALKINTLVNLSAARSQKAALRDKLFFRAAGIKKMIGFPSDPSDFTVVTDPVSGEKEWEAFRLASRISELGPIDLNDNHFWDLKISNREHSDAAAVLPDPGKIIAISAGTKMQAKDWGENNWISLVRLLKSKLPGCRLVMVGASDEFSISEKCLKAWGHNGVNLCGKTSPRVSSVILQKAMLFIGHDSGPMHLAACVNTPCVAIFSARNVPRQWYPRGDNNIILYHKTDCAGCGLEVCIEQKKKCILSISPEEVFGAVMRILSISIDE
jgi:ADP-heptose:LPS heptosyltransferase